MSKESFDIARQDNPVRVRPGSGPVILAVPHSASFVPSEFYRDDYKPLGLPPEWFAVAHPAHRHEVADHGTEFLSGILANNFPGMTVISTTVSRLVVDVDRVRDKAIIQESEDTKAPIPRNVGRSATENEARLKTYYDPYHDALDQAVDNAKQKHGGAVVIHLHSFSPIFQGRIRNREIGTIYPEPHNQLGLLIDEKLQESEGETFESHYPYDLSIRPENALSVLGDRHGVWHAGIEVSQGLMYPGKQLSPKGVSLLGIRLSQLIREVQEAPNFEQILRRDVYKVAIRAPATRHRAHIGEPALVANG